jgi:hypothetical protein
MCDHDPDNRLRNLVLDREDVSQLPVKPLGPSLGARLRIDELRCDPDPAPTLRTLPSTT